MVERGARPIELRCFGGFSLTLNGEHVHLPTQPTRSLLAYLAHLAPRSTPRVFIAEAVWPEAEDEKGLNRLRTGLASIRTPLQPYEVVLGDRNDVALNTEVCATDTSQARRLYQQSRVAQDAATELVLLQELNDLLSSGFLPEWREPWVDAVRVQWVQRERETKLRLAQVSLSLQDHAGALEAVDQLLNLDPVDEEGWTLYFRLMTAANRSGEAIERFRAVRKAWLADNHIDFSEELLNLAKRIRDKQILPETALPAKIPQAERDLVIDVIEKQLDQDPRMVLELCNSQAFRFEALHNPNDALGLMQRAIARTTNDDAQRLEVMIYAAKLAMLVCDYTTVFDYSEEVLENSKPEDPHYRNAVNTIGFANFELRNWDVAETHLRHFHELSFEYGNNYEKSLSCCQLGSIMWHLMRLEESDEYYARGQALLESGQTENEQRSLTILYGNQMFVATIRRDWKLAKQMADLAIRRANVERSMVVTSCCRAVRGMLHAMDGEKSKARELTADSFAATYRNRIFRMHQVSADYVAATLGMLNMPHEGRAVLEAYTGFRNRDSHEHSPAEQYFVEFVRQACGAAEPLREWVNEARPARLVTNVCQSLETA